MFQKLKSILPKSIAGRVMLLLWGLLLPVYFGFLALPYYYYFSYQPKEGDLLFQSLPRSPLVQAIEGCSQSQWSHCGIVVKKDDKWLVLEAIGPVKETPLISWIKQGRLSHIAAYRLKKEYRDQIPAFIKAAYKYKGLPYDVQYEMDDEKIYCSELIFKGFKKATGFELASPQRLGELNWKPYQQIIKYFDKNGNVPVERKMVTPVALTRSNYVKKVY